MTGEQAYGGPAQAWLRFVASYTGPPARVPGSTRECLSAAGSRDRELARPWLLKLRGHAVPILRRSSILSSICPFALSRWCE